MFRYATGNLTDTIAVKVADILTDNILRGEGGLKPGSRVVVSQLSQELGVSATPIKEALKLLANEGLVFQKTPGRGFFVSTVTERDIDETIELFEGLEGLALRLVNGRVPEEVLRQMDECVDRAEAAIEADDFLAYIEEDLHFHSLIAGLPGNVRLQRIRQQSGIQSYIFYLYSPRPGETSRASIAEHRVLLRSFSSGDLAVVEEALTHHYAKARERVHAGFQSAHLLSET